MLLRRTTLRQLLMRPPQSVRAWMHEVAARMYGNVARDAWGLQGPRRKASFQEVVV